MKTTFVPSVEETLEYVARQASYLQVGECMRAHPRIAPLYEAMHPRVDETSHKVDEHAVDDACVSSRDAGEREVDVAIEVHLVESYVGVEEE